jgi:hypothetical protein
MAIQNNPYMYSGGNVRIDNSQYTNFAINLMAKKKAEDDALDQYYSKLPSTINEAGMRDQDRQVFSENMGQVMQYWKQNREAIKNPRKDGGAAQFNYEKMLRSQRELVDRSKQAGKIALEVGKLRFDGKNGHIFDDPYNVEAIKAHDLPVNHPDFKPIDLYDLATPPAPLTAKDFETEAKVITGGAAPSERVTGSRNIGNFKIAQTINHSYDPAQLQQMGQRAEVLYNSDKRYRANFSREYRELISNDDPNDLKPLVESYTQVFGKAPENEKEFFVAQKLRQYGVGRTEEKIVDDVKGKLNYQDGLIRGRMATAQAYRKAYKDYSSKKDAESQEGVLNTFINEQINDGKDAPVATIGGTKYEGKVVKMPKFVAEQVKVPSADNLSYVYPDYFMVTNDKKYVIPIFKDGSRTSAGNPNINGKASEPILMSTYRAMLGKQFLTKSKLGEEIVDDFDDVDTPDVPATPSKTKNTTTTSVETGDLDDL